MSKYTLPLYGEGLVALLRNSEWALVRPVQNLRALRQTLSGESTYVVRDSAIDA